MLTEQDAEAICRYFEKCAEKAGWTRLGSTSNPVSPPSAKGKASGETAQEGDLDEGVDYTLENMTAKAGITLERAKVIIDALQEWSDEHDHWIGVGMALHQEFDASPEALALWDEWFLN